MKICEIIFMHFNELAISLALINQMKNSQKIDFIFEFKSNKNLMQNKLKQ